MLCTPVLLSVPEMEGMSIIYIYRGHPFFEDVPLVGFMYFVLTCIPGESSYR